MMSKSGAHILVFPYPAQGHMIPLLDFTHQLATRGLTITILVTPKNLPIITPLISAHPHSVTPLVLPFPPHPAIPSGVENTIDIPASGSRSVMAALAELHDPIVRWFRNHPSPPVAIVSDMFLGWTHSLACQLSIRRYAFFPSGAFAIAFIYSLWVEMPQRKNVDNDAEMVGFPEIPNSPVYPWWQVSPVYRSYVKGDPNSELIRDSFLGNGASYGLVFNTFDGLDRVHLDYLAKKLGHERVWSIGPFLPPQSDDVGPTERGGSSSISASEISSWLDTCQDHTVVYVCFGSQAVLTNDQMKELALGLEKSGVKFILSVKGATKGHDQGKYGSIPLGFEDRVAGRGLLIKGWAPQMLILKHRAVCAFLTHCGWNSMLESIVAGVPMLAWPMGADQFLNATLLVDQLDVAIRVCEGAETILNADDLVKFLGQVMSEKWRVRRTHALALSKAALDVISEGGSSFNNLDHFARHLYEKYAI
ncbi:UDP-glucuronosyl and UDP-glucosyl transferase [Handroanthus impetiginosus]|uniref:Glycosyltransferase n=1 Tax=Handroanthus impetiginosus TaxID=429701 RepID=A0A2G9GUX0_9LAMI|nr:UDP-glucuronosyl and UDP-glucosyl transferase [Handroanthus impetiginosus]